MIISGVEWCSYCEEEVSFEIDLTKLTMPVCDCGSVLVPCSECAMGKDCSKCNEGSNFTFEQI